MWYAIVMHGHAWVTNSLVCWQIECRVCLLWRPSFCLKFPRLPQRTLSQCTSLVLRPMIVVFVLGTRLHVRMGTKLENGVLRTGQPQSVVNGFYCQGDLKLWKCWMVVELRAVMSISIMLKWRWILKTVCEISLLNLVVLTRKNDTFGTARFCV